MKHALMVVGGWDGHTPEKSADVFVPLLEEAGFEVRSETTLDVYLDKTLLAAQDLIVPIWTQGEKPLSVSFEESVELMELAERAELRVGCAPDTFLRHCNYHRLHGGIGGAVPTSGL